MRALDLDEIFSYQTTKEVRMIDFRLGAVCNCIRLIVLGYVIGYVFIYKEGYTVAEKSVGWTVVDVSGSTYSKTSTGYQPWDAVDAVTPALEDGAAFVATKIAVTPGQTIQDKPDKNQPCSDASTCPRQPPDNVGICASNQFCQVNGWHPVYSPQDSSTQVYELQDSGSFALWMRSAIQFPELDSGRIFSTMSAIQPTPYNGGVAPTGGILPGSQITQQTPNSATIGKGGTGELMPPDHFTVNELLTLAGTSYESVREAGCTLSVSFLWNCKVDQTKLCAPQVQVSRMDLNERRRGFKYTYAHYYRAAGGAQTRDLYTVSGIRILVTAQGEGRKTSVEMIMLQISTAIALLWLASYAADFLMLYVLPEKKHYRTYKQERTPDFSDLRNKIAEVEGERKKLRDRKNRFAAKLDET